MKTHMDSLLGERISNARQAKNLTVEQLASRLGIKVSTLKNWEADRSAPSASKINRLAGILNVPLLWLIGGSDKPPVVEEPEFSETSGIEEKVAHAEALVNELNDVLDDLRDGIKEVQRDLDDVA